MKARRIVLGIFVLFIMAYLPKAAYADIYCEQEVDTKYKDGYSKTTHRKVYVKKDLLKIEEIESGEITIVRLDSQLIIKLNPVDKTYYRLDLPAIISRLNEGDEITTTQRQPKVGAGQEAAKKQMLQSVPEEQREVMAQMMEQAMAKMRASVEGGTDKTTGPPELKLTTDTKTILEHQASRLKVVQTIEGKRKKIVELWVTTEIGPQTYLPDFIESMALFRTSTNSELKKVAGFPLEMKYRIQHGPESDNIQKVTVTKLEDKNILSVEFEVPAGYRPAGTAAAPEAEEEEEEF